MPDFRCVYASLARRLPHQRLDSRYLMAVDKTDRFSNSSVPPENSSHHASETSSALDDSENERGGPAAVQELQRQYEELLEYVRFYLAARVDTIRVALRRTVLSLVMGTLALFVAGAALATCTVIGILGIANLIGQLLGDRLWAGYLITGFGALLIVGLALLLFSSRLKRTSRERTASKYARRRQEQRARFGRDVAGADPAAARPHGE